MSERCCGLVDMGCLWRYTAWRFRVERFAGAGGMGRVYRCYDQHKEAYYALKLLPPVFAEDASVQ
ncbi:hypothetical protein L6R29_11505 [Myxococcota bacterium]|nr:hypothetical protein [Myxococcota bacterium]